MYIFKVNDKTMTISTKHIKLFAFNSLMLALSMLAHGEELTFRSMTLQEVISLAQENSPSAQSAKHAILAAGW